MLLLSMRRLTRDPARANVTILRATHTRRSPGTKAVGTRRGSSLELRSRSRKEEKKEESSHEEEAAMGTQYQLWAL